VSTSSPSKGLVVEIAAYIATWCVLEPGATTPTLTIYNFYTRARTTAAIPSIM
jgi:hypothetical protein